MVDLHDQILQCKCEGDNIILMWDINEHTLSKNKPTLFSSLGIRELVLERYGKKGPATTISKKSDNPFMEYGVQS